jgi:hypothetical protein
MKSLLVEGPIPVTRKKTPLYVEVPVDPVTAPYLVTATRTTTWTDEALNGTMVRAAVRTGIKNTGPLYAEVVEAIAKRGVEWDSVHPLTTEGITKAIEHIQYYGFAQVEALLPSKEAADLVPKVEGLRVDLADWLPDDTIVIVPQNREFVGILGRLSPTAVFVVVHNASRGVAIAKAM